MVGLKVAAKELGIARETLSRRLNSSVGEFNESELVVLQKLTGLSLNEIVYGELVIDEMDSSLCELIAVASTLPPAFSELVLSLIDVLRRE